MGEKFRPASFNIITRRVEIISYRSFGTAYKMRPIGCPETSVRNYHYLLRNNPEERSSYLLSRRKPEITQGETLPIIWNMAVTRVVGGDSKIPDFGQ